MKIDFTQTLRDLKGQEIKDESSKEKKALTLSDACLNALAFTDPKKEISGSEKYKLGKLAMKIMDQKSIDLTVEEISSIKEHVGQAYPSPLLVTIVWDMLEKKDEEKK